MIRGRVAIERETTTSECKEGHTKRPAVSGWRKEGPTIGNLWRPVSLSAAKRGAHATARVALRKAPIREKHPTVTIEKNIVGLVVRVC